MDASLSEEPRSNTAYKASSKGDKAKSESDAEAEAGDIVFSGLRQVSAGPADRLEQPLERPRTLAERLKIPPDLPGANAPPILLPPTTASPEEKQAVLDRLYPAMPPLGQTRKPGPGPTGRALTLADLHNLAMTNSPLIRQASADIEAARGAAIQAGTYPNPNFGYQSDTAGTAATAGFQGVFVEQTIKTAGKLQLAQEAAVMDLQNAQVAFRRAKSDLLTQVRLGYFAVLVAQENVKVNLALAGFTDEVYRVQVEQVKGAQAAPYEPLQLRVLAVQARGSLVQARNRYTAAWKQLASTLGLPGMAPAELSGHVDVPIPLYQYKQVLERVLNSHTDVITAENSLTKSRINLRLAQITPVPDVSLHVAIEKDFSVPPFSITHSIQMGVPVPVWDQNKGNIIQAQGALLRATEDIHRVRADLTNRLATAFEQYEDNRILLEYYHRQILPDQVRAYRGVYTRHQQEPDKVSFGDVVTAQQTLASTITTYVTTLGSTLTAVVNVADFLQTEDLYRLDQPGEPVQSVAPIPDLEQLPTLPCCHPCSPVKDPALKGADGSWQASMPQEGAKTEPTKKKETSDKKPSTSDPAKGTLDSEPSRSDETTLPDVEATQQTAPIHQEDRPAPAVLPMSIPTSDKDPWRDRPNRNRPPQQ
jgi:cobalt-zinc-cadmium efflux system outer membrane protein